jgi:endonuclease/exonuclease/phosphatase family metal-dependent hydrolase
MDIGSGMGGASARGNSAPSTLRLLTLNLGLLGFRLAGTRFIPMAEHVACRLAAAPSQLLSTGADIIALQEVYDRRHRHYITEALRDAYPHAAGVGDRWSLFSNGLMVLSRYPIAEQSYSVAPGFKFHERRVSKKGYLQVEFVVPGIGRIRIINVHLTVSGMFFPSVERVDAHRRHEEIEHLLQLAGIGTNMPAILLGDFNCSPHVHGDHYRHILDAGYVDSFVASEASGDGYTWDAKNNLNCSGPYKDSPSQRIDHVLVPRTLLTRLSPARATLALNEPVVPTEKKSVTVSDHYGMLVDMLAVDADTPKPQSQSQPSSLSRY